MPTSTARYKKALFQDSVNPKNSAIPGYGGYIPSVQAENIHAKGYAPIAKQSFQQEKLGKNVFGFATTGFNLDRTALIDRSKVASSSKYGKTELQRAHPGWNVQTKIIIGRLALNHPR
jgi:hypothetical protein